MTMNTPSAATTERTIIYSMLASLDGYIEAREEGSPWSIVDEEFHRFANEQQHEIDTCLFGSRMYKTMSFWDTVDDTSDLPEYILEFARSWKQQQKIVFSRSLDTVQNNARIATSDLVTEIAELRRQPGKDIVIGGAELAASAMARDLIDEFRLYIQPVVLGGGKPCFRAGESRIELELTDTRIFASGVVYLNYRRDRESIEGTP